MVITTPKQEQKQYHQKYPKNRHASLSSSAASGGSKSTRTHTRTRTRTRNILTVLKVIFACSIIQSILNHMSIVEIFYDEEDSDGGSIDWTKIGYSMLPINNNLDDANENDEEEKYSQSGDGDGDGDNEGDDHDDHYYGKDNDMERGGADEIVKEDDTSQDEDDTIRKGGDDNQDGDDDDNNKKGDDDKESNTSGSEKITDNRMNILLLYPDDWRHDSLGSEDVAIDNDYDDDDDDATDEDGDEDITDLEMPKPTNSNEQESIAVFYNVFTKSVDDIEKVNSIVKEQFELLLPEHKVFVRSIGTELHIDNVELIRHDASGEESDTLQLLWEHCSNSPDSKVVYLHSKGSFHGTEDNEKLRRFLTRGALSKECANLPSSCNVCSSRMSPIPHPHTSGNMWLARCDYIKKLFEPKNFQSKMQDVPLRHAFACAGRGRYAAEHWVHSHPDVMPCDVSHDEKYVWNYGDVPGADFPINLKMAPRFDLDVYKINNVCTGWGESLEDRLAEYKYLYGEEPSESWWGWKLFNQTHVNE